MSLNEGELSSLLTSLTNARQRIFLRMIEDECLNLLHEFRQSRGKTYFIRIPALSQNWRELVTLTTERFFLKDIVLAEGDLEKEVQISVRPTSRVPCILYSDLIPPFCPLLSHAVHGPPPPRSKPTASPSRPSQAQPASPNSQEDTSSRDSSAPASSPEARGKARPTMGVYRPRRMMEMRESGASTPSRPSLAADDKASPASADSSQMQDEKSARDTDKAPTKSSEIKDESESQSSPAQKNILDSTAASENVAESVNDDDEEEGMAELVHWYDKFKMDLTPKSFFDQQKRQPYAEFDITSSGPNSKSENTAWRWDEAWQLKSKNNGTITFCIQAETREGVTVLVGLAGENAGSSAAAATCVIALQSAERTAIIERRHRGTTMARVQGTGEGGTPPSSSGQTSPQASGRPAPEKFWVVVRGGMVAVGHGAHTGVGGIIAVMHTPEPIDEPWKRVGFCVVRDKSSSVSLFRIILGGKICQQAASVTHIRLFRGDVSLAATRHTHLTDTPRTAHTPPRGYAAWKTFPSCATWVLPPGSGAKILAGSATEASSSLVSELGRHGVVVVASSPGWGWALLSSPASEDIAKEVVVKHGGEWVGDMACASREELIESGLPTARERPATSPMTANRLISSALRPASGGARGPATGSALGSAGGGARGARRSGQGT